MFENSITDTSMTACDKIISVMDFVSTKVKYALATNITRNPHSKKVRDCYSFHAVLVVSILLLTISFFCYHYAKQKDINALTI